MGQDHYLEIKILVRMKELVSKLISKNKELVKLLLGEVKLKEKTEIATLLTKRKIKNNKSLINYLSNPKTYNDDDYFGACEILEKLLGNEMPTISNIFISDEDDYTQSAENEPDLQPFPSVFANFDKNQTFKMKFTKKGQLLEKMMGQQLRYIDWLDGDWPNAEGMEISTHLFVNLESLIKQIKSFANKKQKLLLDKTITISIKDTQIYKKNSLRYISRGQTIAEEQLTILNKLISEILPKGFPIVQAIMVFNDSGRVQYDLELTPDTPYAGFDPEKLIKFELSTKGLALQKLLKKKIYITKWDRVSF